MFDVRRASICRAPTGSTMTRSTAYYGARSRACTRHSRCNTEPPLRNMSEHDESPDAVTGTPIARRMTRREMLAAAAASSVALGAALAWPRAIARAATPPSERRDLFPQGVASGDPHPDSVLLWTRRPPIGDSRATTLRAEVASDPEFRRVISSARATLSVETDWTCRVLAAGLRPSRVYWYRFV